MTAYSDRFRAAAEATRRAADWTRIVCAGVGASGSAHWLYSAFFFELITRVSGDLAADPPREDFDKPTRVGARHATPEFVTPISPAERVAVKTAVAADDSARYMGAHLRAFERLQGAQNDRADSAAALHREEAVKFAREASEALGQLASELDELISYLPSDWARRLTPEQQYQAAQLEPQELDDDALAFLFLGGLRVSNLQDVVAPSNELSSPDSARTEVEAAPKVFRDLAGYLARWSPSTNEQPA